MRWSSHVTATGRISVGPRCTDTRAHTYTTQCDSRPGTAVQTERHRAQYVLAVGSPSHLSAGCASDVGGGGSSRVCAESSEAGCWVTDSHRSVRPDMLQREHWHGERRSPRIDRCRDVRSTRSASPADGVPFSKDRLQVRAHAEWLCCEMRSLPSFTHVCKTHSVYHRLQRLRHDLIQNEIGIGLLVHLADHCNIVPTHYVQPQCHLLNTCR